VLHAQNFRTKKSPLGTTIKPAAAVTPFLLCLQLFLLRNPLCLHFPLLLIGTTGRLQPADCYLDTIIIVFQIGKWLSLDVFFVVLPKFGQFFFNFDISRRNQSF
jgi:hypothetical protein